eukprot:TRINITY_DN22141_c0_g1_i1.p2 TRINITY_DN22141_c0_g1~~TRINITY_DN22141_c0_g1_i1.p2  ORF type:complete len:133 (+),score=12.63 TRINITY_DN22141_c0_g1_i1:448-846(+)
MDPLQLAAYDLMSESKCQSAAFLCVLWCYPIGLIPLAGSSTLMTMFYPRGTQSLLFLSTLAVADLIQDAVSKYLVGKVTKCNFSRCFGRLDRKATWITMWAGCGSVMFFPTWVGYISFLMEDLKLAVFAESQ